jgi:hypothetical protein
LTPSEKSVGASMVLASPATTLSGPGMAAARRRIVSRFGDAWHEDAVSPRFEVAHRALDRLGEDIPLVPAN